MLSTQAWTFDHTFEIPLLSVEECDLVRGFVHRNRQRWVSKSDAAPFFALGAAAYLEAADDGARVYHLRARKMNALLWGELDWLYQRLRAKLGEALGEEAIFPRRFALPGFHIFLAHPAFSRAVCSIHCDLQFEHLRWPLTDQVDPTRTFSFTVPIAIPTTGAGLRVWEMDRAEFASDAELTVLDQRRMKVHHYQRGRMVVHGGFLVHQMAPFSEIAEGEERLTLQGHALYSRRGWLLYW